MLELLRLLGAQDFRPNLGRVAELFAHDAAYQINVPARDQLVGREAIIAELARQAGDFTDLVSELLAIVSDDRRVVTERVDHVTMRHSNERVTTPVLAIFEVDGDGRIRGWREYWDALSLAARMRVDAEHMQRLMGISA